MTFSKHIVANWKYLYITVQCTSPLLFAVFITVWAYLDDHADERTMCIVVAPLQGLVYNVFSNAIMAVNIAILIIYAMMFLILIK
ncbi:hypothetical protein Aduo_011418 [Ancylostoma duodenale]